MACLKISRAKRLSGIITISFAFFVVEIAVGFRTHSLALIADSFHYLSDLIGFIVALIALKMSEREDTPSNLSFGWQRAQLLGAFFNGVFLVALAVSIFLQSIERFVSIEEMQSPLLVLVVGCVGLTLNIISALFLHEHDHDHHVGDTVSPAKIEDGQDDDKTIDIAHTSPVVCPHLTHRHHTTTTIEQPSLHGHHDLGMLGVLLHVLSDAINNIGVIIAALVIHLAHYPSRFYADPGVSMAIAFMILVSAYPLCKHSGFILLQAAPLGVDLDDVKYDLEKIPGVEAVHELHVWRLSQHKSVATAHVVVNERDLKGFTRLARVVGECLCAYGVHSVTLQPEMMGSPVEVGGGLGWPMLQQSRALGELRGDGMGFVRAQEVEKHRKRCRISCGRVCEKLKCCG